MNLNLDHQFWKDDCSLYSFDCCDNFFNLKVSSLLVEVNFSILFDNIPSLNIINEEFANSKVLIGTFGIPFGYFGLYIFKNLSLKFFPEHCSSLCYEQNCRSEVQCSLLYSFFDDLRKIDTFARYYWRCKRYIWWWQWWTWIDSVDCQKLDRSYVDVDDRMGIGKI